MTLTVESEPKRGLKGDLIQLLMRMTSVSVTLSLCRETGPTNCYAESSRHSRPSGP